MNILTAKQARKIATNQQLEAEKNQLVKISSLIKQASSRGKTTLRYQRVTEENLSVLLELGFKVRAADSYNTKFDISWEV